MWHFKQLHLPSRWTKNVQNLPHLSTWANVCMKRVTVAAMNSNNKNSNSNVFTLWSLIQPIKCRYWNQYSTIWEPYIRSTIDPICVIMTLFAKKLWLKKSFAPKYPLWNYGYLWRQTFLGPYFYANDASIAKFGFLADVSKCQPVVLLSFLYVNFISCYGSQSRKTLL